MGQNVDERNITSVMIPRRHLGVLEGPGSGHLASDCGIFRTPSGQEIQRAAITPLSHFAHTISQFPIQRERDRVKIVTLYARVNRG